MSPWGNCFTPGSCAANISAQKFKLAQTQPSQGTNSDLVQVEPWRFISCALKNSNVCELLKKRMSKYGSGVGLMYEG